MFVHTLNDPIEMNGKDADRLPNLEEPYQKSGNLLVYRVLPIDSKHTLVN